MNTQVVVLAAVTVLLHVPAGRGYSVKSRNSEHQLDAGDGTGMKRVPEESDVSNQDLDAGSLVLVKESVGNDLHDIRRREARSRKWSRKRQGESGDEPEADQEHVSKGKAFVQEISDFLEPKKEMITNFMKPILDRIKHKPKTPSVESTSDVPTSPAPTTPAPSSTPSDSETPGSSDASTPSGSGSSSSTDSSDDDFPLFPFSFSNCGENGRHRSANMLSLLFPDLQSNEGEQPFVFLPLTNTLMRVVEQQIIRESQSGGDLRRKLHK